MNAVKYPNGTIINSTPVQLRKHETDAVERMYSRDVLERTTVERITYMSDGLRINGYLARPKAAGRYPVLIWNRGGSGDRGALHDLTAFLILASTALWGYIVLATHYRGNRGSEGVEDWGGEDVRDSLNLVETAKYLPGADLDRFGIEGASRGGMTTYRVLTLDSRFRCAIVHAGVTDICSMCDEKKNFARFCDQLLSQFTPEEREAELKRRSALHFVRQLPKTTPILLLHGDQDRVIPLSQTEAFAAELQKLDLPYESHVLAGGGHVALKDGSYREIDTYRKEWLERYLSVG